MREILFRGKRVDNGEWVYGFLVEALNCVTDKNETFIIEQDATYFTHGEFACAVEVIPETVGQFTGIKDKSGKKIFEGDIVKVTIGLQGYQSTYDLVKAAFSYKSVNCTVKYKLNDSRMAAFYPFINPNIKEVEVVGNIYDNEEEKE
jgi:uncharacterized phage protein (TIGR01671 family)